MPVCLFRHAPNSKIFHQIWIIFLHNLDPIKFCESSRPWQKYVLSKCLAWCTCLKINNLENIKFGLHRVMWSYYLVDLVQGPSLVHVDSTRAFPSRRIYLFVVLRGFQPCTGHITMGSWKGRG